MINNHENMKIVANVEGLQVVEVTATKDYGHAYYLFLCFTNNYGNLVPVYELTKYRQNAWNTRQLPVISQEILNSYLKAAENKLNGMMLLGKDEVDQLFSLRYRQKMTANRASALVAREYVAEKLAFKSVTYAGLASTIVECAIHGKAPKTQPLQGDTWKVIRIFRALCKI